MGIGNAQGALLRSRKSESTFVLCRGVYDEN